MSDKKINAHCDICGAGYHICNTCLQQKSFKSWRVVTDTVEHYKIYMAVHGYTLSQDKETAKRELEKCDLSGLEDFNPPIRAVIQEILSEEDDDIRIPSQKES
ncbi:MAG: hypothetical protein HFG37_04015 [Eubacterium sp.]|nr:hypothetical protein [Eubacterium sp.]